MQNSIDKPEPSEQEPNRHSITNGSGELPGPIIIYEANEPLTEGQRFMAFLTAPLKYNVDSRRFGLLPVQFTAGTALEARQRAIAFWKDETIKARAMRERGRKLGLARRKAPLTDQTTISDQKTRPK